jgi:hypothetical protein
LAVPVIASWWRLVPSYSSKPFLACIVSFTISSETPSSITFWLRSFISASVSDDASLTYFFVPGLDEKYPVQ